MEDQRRRFKVDFGRREPAATGHQPGSVPVEVAPAHHGATHQPKPKKLGFFTGRKWLLVLIVVFVAVIGALTYGYLHTKSELNKAKNPTAAGKTEAEQITNQINKYVDLPTTETPTLATVSDVSKLKTQTFFKNAQNGDKVLIYTRAGTAVLYRPSTKKVIEYAPVNSSSPAK
jgi:hypothetical protein